jgi:hypothetical protein
MLRHEHFSCKSSKHHATFYKLLGALMIKPVQVQATFYIYDMIQIWQKNSLTHQKDAKKVREVFEGLSRNTS